MPRRLAAVSAVAVLLFAVSAYCQDVPKRKSGLWEITMDRGAASGRAPAAMTMSQCVDQARDDLVRQMGQQMERENKCTRTNVKQSAGRLSFDASCDFGTMKTSSSTVITGDFNSAYKVEVRSKFDPPMMGKSEGTTVMEAKWVGTCKPGQRPGDVTMPGGMTMNVYDMMETKTK